MSPHRRRSKFDDDVDVKPYAANSRNDVLLERDIRDPYRDEPIRTSVRTRFGPGGKSKLAEAGGLGAFLCGAQVDEEDNNFIPRHRRIQEQVSDSPL
jgi:hypothetical protein